MEKPQKYHLIIFSSYGVVRFVVFHVNTLVRASIGTISFERVLEKTKHGTFIKKFFPAIMYRSDRIPVSLYRSGVVTANGSFGERKLNLAIYDLVRMLQKSNTHDGVFFEEPKTVNVVYNLKPQSKIKVDVNSLHGVSRVRVFAASKMVLDSGATALIYKNGNAILTGGNEKSVSVSVDEIIHKIQEHSREI